MIFETNLSKYVPKSGRTFIDIGASEGAWCYSLSPSYKRIIAFEPNPVNWQGGEVEIHKEVLSDAEKEVIFYFFNNPNCSGYVFGNKKQHLSWVNNDVVGEKKIIAKTLDSYDFPDVDLIKIDVEGAEYDVLKGAKKTIKKHHPKLIIENHTKNYKKIEKLLCSLGYKLQTVLCERDPSMERYFWIIGDYDDNNL